MSLSLTENLPVLSHAIQHRSALPPTLKTDLHRACFAVVSILFNEDLSSDPEQAISVIRDLDFTTATIPTITDHASLAIALRSIGHLRENQGVFLPAADIITELLRCSILQTAGQEVRVLGERSAIIEYYGSQFPLLDGEIIIDTKLGRIKNVLEIEPRLNRAIVEILPATSTGSSLLTCVIDHNRPILTVGKIKPTEFRFITFNEQGAAQGVYQIGGEIYLFQNARTFDLDLEGKFVKAEFLKETNLPTGLIATSKYLYLVNQGQLHAKLAVKDYSGFQLQSALVEMNNSAQVVFWGTVSKGEWDIPFLNCDLSDSNYQEKSAVRKDKKNPKKVESLEIQMKTDPVFYQGQLYFQAEVADRGQSLYIVSLDDQGKPQANTIFSINGLSVSSFEPFEDFIKSGNGLVHAEGETFCLLKGGFYQQSRDLQFLSTLKSNPLQSSEPFFPSLLCTPDGWRLVADTQNIFNLESVVFSLDSKFPIGIHVSPKMELTCLAELPTGEKLLYCASHPIRLTEIEDFQSLEGVRYGLNNQIACLFRGRDGYVSLVFEERGDDILPISSLALSDAKMTPLGIIGNLESITPLMVINDQTIEGYQYQDYLAVNLKSGRELHCIQTDRGVVVMSHPWVDNEIYHDYQMGFDMQGNLVLTKSDPTIQIGVKLNSTLK